MKKKVFGLMLLIVSVFSFADKYDTTEEEEAALDSTRGYSNLFLSRYPDLYGGSYVDYGPFRLVLQVTDTSQAYKLIDMYSEDIYKYLEIREVDFTYQELISLQAEIGRTLNSQKIRHSSFTDIKAGKVYVGIIDSDSNKAFMSEIKTKAQQKAKINNKNDPFSRLSISYSKELNRPQ